MANPRLHSDSFLNTSKSTPILDVRSPAEFKEGHIPNAVSFPLFSNNERAEIGTMYKQQGSKQAVRKGLEIVGPRMVDFVDKAEKFRSEKLRIYCWRGGMRSESMAWLLSKAGFVTEVLEGGYKAYRNQLLSYFDQKLLLQVISGYTGSRKTKLLELLKEADEQVVDLEALAGHQGSAFGNRKSIQQPTTEQFQNDIYEVFRGLDVSKPIWIEDESMKIGQVSLVERLYQQKNTSPHYVLEVSKEERVDFLLSDYESLSKEQLKGATSSISKKLGAENSTLATECIESGDLKTAAEIILTYYDSQYKKSLSKKEHLVVARYNIGIDELESLVPILKEKVFDEV